MANYNKGKDCAFYKHGLTDTRLYVKWTSMKSRCYNSNNKDYPKYGGRGIIVVDEWKHNPVAFVNYCMTLDGWDDESLELDRINTNGNYERNNIRFTTELIQSRNKNVYNNNKTGYSGIFYIRGKNKYRAEVSLEDNAYWIKVYNTLPDAIDGRNDYIKRNNLTGYAIQSINNEDIIDEEEKWYAQRMKYLKLSK